MKIGEKLRYLREVEGTLRGYGRAMSQSEVSRVIAEELGQPMSQSYLSQIESGKRPHMTNTTRLTLARFFKVHPGYLVDDPEGFQTELISDVRSSERSLDVWLQGGAERFSDADPEVAAALEKIADHEDSRDCILLLASILETPDLATRLLEVLRPSLPIAKSRERARRKR